MLGGLLLDNDAADRIARLPQRARLLQRCASIDLRRDHAAHRGQQAGRRRDRRRRLKLDQQARIHRRHALISARSSRTFRPPRTSAATPRSCTSARYCAACAAAGGEIAENAFHPLGRSVRGNPRPGGNEGLRDRRARRARAAGVPGNPAAADAGRGADRVPVQPRQSFRRHRHRDRVHRSGPDDVRAAGGRSHRHRRASEHGQVRRLPSISSEHIALDAENAGRGVQHGNGRDTAGDAPDGLGRPPGPAENTHGALEQRRLGAAVRRARASSTMRRSISTRRRL